MGTDRRRKPFKKQIILFLSGILTGLILTACAGASDQTSEMTAQDPVSEQAENELVATQAASDETEEWETEEIPEIVPVEDETEEIPEIAPEESKQTLTFGDERTQEYLPLLEDKRVALFSNQTGIVGDRTETGEHILDLLVANDVNVTAVFSPEHGFRGDADAGKAVESSVDEKTGVPIRSLYSGKSHYPSDADMDSFDCLVVDLQDVGVRFYTYHISLFYLMEACAAKDKEIIILDRPNPNGFYVDGPVLQDEFRSGVGRLPLPVVYGMTWGELAGMINGEGWLSTGRDSAKLTVICCENYSHADKVPIAVSPSPNLKDMQAVYLYASTCYFENTVVSVGRGTMYPFETYGSPYLKDVEGFEYSFTPESMSGASDPPFLGKTCYGKDLRSKELSDIWEAGIDLSYLIDAYHAVKEKDSQLDFFGKPDGSGIYWIDKLFGTDCVRKMIEEGKSADEIKASWQDELTEFKALRSKYLLYEQ